MSPNARWLALLGAASAYLRPHDAGWPDNAAWSALDASLEGKISADVETPTWWWEDPRLREPQTCAACESDPYCRLNAAGGTCSQDPACNRGFCQAEAAFNLPQRVAEVASADDVSKVLAFASEHDIQVAVKTTGHSYQGSSTARDSLLIWTRGLPKLGQVTPGDYVDSCGTAAGAVATLEIGGGATWSDAYGAVAGRYHAVGGGCMSVSAAGGWLQGGGLASTTRRYGMGVDNVLKFEVVLADGSQVVADACSEPELFWALRGGGGGTFGVVTSVVYRLHAVEPIVSVNCYNTDASQRSALLDFWIARAPHLDDRWGGHWDNGGIYLHFVGSEADADATFTDDLRAWAAGRATVEVFESASYYDQRGGAGAINNDEHTQPTGERLNIASRLVPRQWALDNPTALRDLVLSSTNDYVMGYFLGGNMGNVATDATAVHPAARSAIFNLMTFVDEDHARVRAVLTDDITGICYNHHAALEPNWRVAAWGANYDRLLAAKRRYDPCRRFNCWHCVGYEGAEMEQGDDVPDCWSPGGNASVCDPTFVCDAAARGGGGGGADAASAASAGLIAGVVVGVAALAAIAFGAYRLHALQGRRGFAPACRSAAPVGAAPHATSAGTSLTSAKTPTSSSTITKQ